MAGNINQRVADRRHERFLPGARQRSYTQPQRRRRTIKLRDLYKGYKQLDRSPDEIVGTDRFRGSEGADFNFEKVCKRTYLDIASVNSACLVKIQ